MRFSVYQLTHQGARPRNEDRMGYCYTSQAGLFAVADGMGGHPDGEVAAQLALKTVAGRFQAEARPALGDPQRFLYEAFIAAHQQLLRYATGRSMADTPRTTLVACVLQGGSAWWAHCGDSRLYLQRGVQLLTRTRDHSYQEIQGTLSVLMPEAEKLGRNVLFTCLGSPGTPVIDNVGPVPLQVGDRVLLCSDGLWAPLAEETIVRTMGEGPVPQAVQALVARALEEGGPRCDNVTVLGVEWEGLQARAQADAQAADGAGADAGHGAARGALAVETEPWHASGLEGVAAKEDLAPPLPGEGLLGPMQRLNQRLNETLRRAVSRKGTR